MSIISKVASAAVGGDVDITATLAQVEDMRAAMTEMLAGITAMRELLGELVEIERARATGMSAWCRDDA